MDNVYLAEHDCLVVEDDVVFGSVVSVHCGEAGGKWEEGRKVFYLRGRSSRLRKAVSNHGQITEFELTSLGCGGFSVI